jgi:hypothetical protein
MDKHYLPIMRLFYVYLSIYDSTALVDLSRFFTFLIYLYIHSR